MVEGLFAGYKQHTDGKFRGEYLVYDRTSYENWKGLIDLPIHTTKEIYIPGDAADSRDAPEFQFPVRDGDWHSKAPELNRYRKTRYKKRDTKASGEGPGARLSPGSSLQSNEAGNEAGSDKMEMIFSMLHSKK